MNYSLSKYQGLLATFLLASTSLHIVSPVWAMSWDLRERIKKSQPQAVPCFNEAEEAFINGKPEALTKLRILWDNGSDLPREFIRHLDGSSNIFQDVPDSIIPEAVKNLTIYYFKPSLCLKQYKQKDEPEPLFIQMLALLNQANTHAYSLFKEEAKKNKDFFFGLRTCAIKHLETAQFTKTKEVDDFFANFKNNIFARYEDSTLPCTNWYDLDIVAINEFVTGNSQYFLSKYYKNIKNSSSLDDYPNAICKSAQQTYKKEHMNMFWLHLATQNGHMKSCNEFEKSFYSKLKCNFAGYYLFKCESIMQNREIPHVKVIIENLFRTKCFAETAFYIEKYLKFSRNPDAELQCRLGIQYIQGKGVSKNLDKAFQYFKLSADQGNAPAQCNLGIMYRKGEGVSKDPQKAFHYFKLSADQGNAQARYNLGLNYMKGEGVSKDPQIAFHYLELSGNQGNAEAQCDLGIIYGEGRGVEKNPQKALQYFKLSADQGNADALCELGIMYREGHGVEKNPQKALQYFKLSADQGNADALCNWSIMYLQEAGVTKDYFAKHFKLSAGEINTEPNPQLLEMCGGGTSTGVETAKILELPKARLPLEEIDSQNDLASCKNKDEGREQKTLTQTPSVEPKETSAESHSEKQQKPSEKSEPKANAPHSRPLLRTISLNDVSSRKKKDEVREQKTLQKRHSQNDLVGSSEINERPLLRRIISLNNLPSVEGSERKHKPLTRTSSVELKETSSGPSSEIKQKSRSSNRPLKDPFNPVKTLRLRKSEQKQERKNSQKELKMEVQSSPSTGEPCKTLIKLLSKCSSKEEIKLSEKSITKTLENLKKAKTIKYRKQDNTISATKTGNQSIHLTVHCHDSPDQKWPEKPEIMNDVLNFVGACDAKVKKLVDNLSKSENSKIDLN